MSETSADALLAAIQAHLRTEVMPKLEGFDAFSARVAANAVGIARREWAARDELDQLEADLAVFAPPAENETAAQSVARALRDGQLAADDSLVALLRRRTLARIQVDNPRYSGLLVAQKRWCDRTVTE